LIHCCILLDFLWGARRCTWSIRGEETALESLIQMEDNHEWSSINKAQRCGIANPSGSTRIRRRSAAFRLLWLWVRNPLGVRMSVSCECWMLSVRGLCDSQSSFTGVLQSVCVFVWHWVQLGTTITLYTCNDKVD
jgi:hypothetical protein